jgi:hypothetical protein
MFEKDQRAPTPADRKQESRYSRHRRDTLPGQVIRAATGDERTGEIQQ